MKEKLRICCKICEVSKLIKMCIIIFIISVFKDCSDNDIFDMLKSKVVTLRNLYCFRPQYLDSNDRSYPKDSPTYRRDGTVVGFNPAKTSVLDGYSCFIKEYHQRSLKPQRRTLPRAQNYRDFEKSSRDEYRQNFIRRELSSIIN